MSELYNDCYIKTVDDYTYWYVKDGRRTKVEDAAQMHEIGILHVHVLSEDELQAIPIKGARKPKKTAEGEQPESL